MLNQNIRLVIYTANCLPELSSFLVISVVKIPAIIASKKDDNFWQLSIVNSVDANSSAASTKTCLKNIETRLALMFSNQARFSYQKTATQFSVILELPYA